MTQRAVILDVDDSKGTAREPADERLQREESAARSPIFADALNTQPGLIDHVIVERVGPVREGQLGKFEPEIDEQEIVARHGGGKYRVVGRNMRGQPIKDMFKTIDLAGDPIFQSEVAEAQYRRQMRLPPAGAPTQAQGLSMADIVALLTKSSDRQEEADRRRAGELEAQHKRDLERIKAETEASAAARAAEEERRRAAERERDEQRRKDDAEREERREKAAEESRRRDREFQLQMATIARGADRGAAAADPTKLLLAGVELATKLRGGGGGGEGGGGSDDPVAAFMQNLPGIIEGLKGTLGGAAAPAAAAAGGVTPAANDPNSLTLVGPLGKKGHAAMQALKAKGIDPARALDQVFDMALHNAGAAPAAPTSPASNGPAVPTFGARRGPGGRPIHTAPDDAPPAPAANGQAG